MKQSIKTGVQFIITISLVVVLSACPKPQQYPDEPQIKFKQFILMDTVDLLNNPIKRVKLWFSLIDGDGNIGLKDSDTTGVYDPDSTYYYNFFTTGYEIIDGDTIKFIDEKQRNFRIPYVEPQGQVKTLMADIYTDIDFSYLQNGQLPYDSIFLDFYIVDRAFNMSNIERSVTLKLDTIGKFPDLSEQ
jgi:hypothetical protein